MMSISYKRMKLKLTISTKKWILKIFWVSLREYLILTKAKSKFLKTRFKNFPHNHKNDHWWRNKWKLIYRIYMIKKKRLRSGWFGINIFFIFIMKKSKKKILKLLRKLENLSRKNVHQKNVTKFISNYQS